MQAEDCRLCGGDGRIGNTLGGSNAKCPSCHGTGRRAAAEPRFHDVTKTKASHYAPAPQVAAGPKAPVTPEGAMLAAEVTACAALGADAKARLIAEIMAHEGSHGRCTKTFIKKLRKQTRPAG
jgi:RecJ-like exonuclease